MTDKIDNNLSQLSSSIKKKNVPAFSQPGEEDHILFNQLEIHPIHKKLEINTNLTESGKEEDQVTPY